MTYEQLLLQATQTRVGYIVDVINAVDQEVISQMKLDQPIHRAAVLKRIEMVLSVFTLAGFEREVMAAEALHRICEKLPYLVD